MCGGGGAGGVAGGVAGGADTCKARVPPPSIEYRNIISIVLVTKYFVNYLYDIYIRKNNWL